MNTESKQMKQSPLIVVVGAGGIVAAAHLPAYQKRGWSVIGICDPSLEKAERLAAQWGIPNTASHVSALLANLAKQNIFPSNPIIFDIAVPASVLQEVLLELPPHSFVLMQKPMGESKVQAEAILQIVKEKKFSAAVNFQLRFAPGVLKLMDLLRNGELGIIHEIHADVRVHTPWHLWDFLKGIEAMEILYHSIHYIDLIRQLARQGLPEAPLLPSRVVASTWKSASSADLTATQSAIHLHYSPLVRCTISTSHHHHYGNTFQHAYVVVEGAAGAVRFEMGVLKNYPDGEADALYLNKGAGWESIQLNGDWFPDAFGESMKQMLDWASKGIVPSHTADDAYLTMCTVEAAVQDARGNGTAVLLKNGS